MLIKFIKFSKSTTIVYPLNTCIHLFLKIILYSYSFYFKISRCYSNQDSQMGVIYIPQHPNLKLSLIDSLLYISQQFFQNGRKGLYWNKPRIGDQPNTKFSLLVEGIQTQPPLGSSRHYTVVAHCRASPKVNGHIDHITVQCATPRLHNAPLRAWSLPDTTLCRAGHIPVPKQLYLLLKILFRRNRSLKVDL